MRKEHIIHKEGFWLSLDFWIQQKKKSQHYFKGKLDGTMGIAQ